MQKKSAVLDANIILRFLLADLPDQTARVRLLFKSATKSSLEIPDIVIAEVIYVLLTYYKLPKAEIIQKISIFITHEIFVLNLTFLQKSLEIYAENNIAFADSYLCALVALEKNEQVYSFDKKLTKVKEVKVREP